MRALLAIPALIALLLSPAGPAAAGDALGDTALLVEGIRDYHDGDVARAATRFQALHERGVPDASWWLSRCWLALERPEQALEVLSHGVVLRIEPWRRSLVRAEALLALGRRDEAWEVLRAGSPPESPGRETARDWRVFHWLSAALAAENARESKVILHLQAVAGRRWTGDLEPRLARVVPVLDDLRHVQPLRPLPPGITLWFRHDDGYWALPAGSELARRRSPPLLPVQEVDGPDLAWTDGDPVFRVAGRRFAPCLLDGVLWYGAGFEPASPRPDRAGLYRWEVGSPRPRRVTQVPAGSLDTAPCPSPSGAVWFVRRSRDRSRLYVLRDGRETALAPDQEAVAGVAGCRHLTGEEPEGTAWLYLAVATDAGPRLRLLPAEAGPHTSTLPFTEKPFPAWAPRTAASSERGGHPEGSPEDPEAQGPSAGSGGRP